MNSKRSYLETLNAGRQRRAHSSIEQLNRSLETLEQRIGRNADTLPDRPTSRRSRRSCPAHIAPRSPARTSRRGRAEPSLSTAAPRTRRCRAAPEREPAYQSLAREFDRVRGQEDSVAAVGKIAGELKGLREELRHQMTTGLAREFDALRKDIERAYSSPLTAKNGARARRRIRTAFGRHPVAVRKDRRQEHQAAAARAGAGARRARHAGARGHGAFGRPALGRFRRPLQQIRGSLRRAVARARTRSGDRGADRRGSNRSTTPSTTCRNRCRCVRSRRRCARWPARSIISRGQQDGSGNAPFDVIEERLDEISRAIVASTATRDSHRISTPSRSSGSRRGSPRLRIRSRNWSKIARAAR